MGAACAADTDEEGARGSRNAGLCVCHDEDGAGPGAISSKRATADADRASPDAVTGRVDGPDAGGAALGAAAARVSAGASDAGQDAADASSMGQGMGGMGPEVNASRIRRADDNVRTAQPDAAAGAPPDGADAAAAQLPAARLESGRVSWALRQWQLVALLRARGACGGACGARINEAAAKARRAAPVC